MPKSILVLDDDPNFRELLVRILHPTGFQVVEAATADEALAADARADYVLAIVDFRLPEVNGMQFVERLRACGLNTPVIFISALACDPKTFNFLRNILRVSLVLQKPIDPNLFLQQIDVLLPQDRQSNAVSSTYEERAVARPTQVDQAEQIRTKEKFQTTVQNAQRDLAAKMPQEWNNLATSLRAFQHDLKNPVAREQALMQAHKLRGTAGSLGLMKVSDAAAKIEDFTKLLDPQDALQEEILWLEIFRALADGESALSGLTQGSQPEQPIEEHALPNLVLFLGNERTFRTGERLQFPLAAHITFTDSPVQAALKAGSTRFDAAVLDLSMPDKKGVFNLARALRINGLNDALPLAFVESANEKLEEAERVFYGCTTALKAPCTHQAFELSLRTLAAVKHSKPVRILTVDDDPILTSLTERVLRGEGMAVSTLNQPINIMETLEKTQPDLVLLDVIMPGLSGYDVCRLVRKSEKWNEIPIVFLTSKSDAQGRAAAFYAGANDFLSKPIIAEELIARVKGQLKRDWQKRQQGSTDQITGLPTKESFLVGAEDFFLSAVQSGGQMSLCLIEVDDFDKLDTYGMFAKLNVLSTFAKLIISRFTPEVLRGRWEESGFALAFRNEQGSTVEKASELLAGELEPITFMGDIGGTFSVRVRTASAHYPQETMSLSALVDAAKYRLASPKAFR
jgi:DNA-binding response OmpR family regulator